MDQSADDEAVQEALFDLVEEYKDFKRENPSAPWSTGGEFLFDLDRSRRMGSD